MARQKKAPARKPAAAKKKKAAGSPPRGKAARRAAGRQSAPELLRDAWRQTLRALGAAEAEVERQIRALMKRNRIQAPDASRALAEIASRIQKERRQAVEDVEARIAGLQKQIRKERRAVDKMVEDAVERTLASFNIPSRREVKDLTRKVDQLSRKLDALPRRRSRSA